MTISFEEAFSPDERVELATAADATVEEVDRETAENMIRGYRPLPGLRFGAGLVMALLTAFLLFTAGTPRVGMIHVLGVTLGLLALPVVILYAYSYHRAISAFRDTRSLQKVYDLPFVGARLIANAPRLRNEEWPHFAQHATRVMRVQTYRALDGLSFYAVRFPDGMVILRTADGKEPRSEIERLRGVGTWAEARERMGLVKPEIDADPLS